MVLKCCVIKDLKKMTNFIEGNISCMVNVNQNGDHTKSNFAICL
jgi:hypothetical protein